VNEGARQEMLQAIMDSPDAVVVRSEERFSQAVGALNAYTDHGCSDEILLAAHHGRKRWYAWYATDATDLLMVTDEEPAVVHEMPQEVKPTDAGDMVEMAAGWPCCKEVDV